MEADDGKEEPRPRIRVKIAGLERMEPTGTSQTVTRPVPEEEQAPQLEIVRYPYTAG